MQRLEHSHVSEDQFDWEGQQIGIAIFQYGRIRSSRRGYPNRPDTLIGVRLTRKNILRKSALWESPWLSHIWWCLSEEAVAFKIEINTLKQMLNVENAITTAFEHLDFVVEAFHETASIALDEEI